jgi:hypothetical protein
MTHDVTLKDKKRTRRRVKHGALLTSRLIHDSPVPGIGSMLRQAEAAIVEDLGGAAEMSGKERLQTQNVLRCLHILYSLDYHLMGEGVMDGPEVRPAVQKYLDTIGTMSRVLQSLGLRKEVRDKVPPLSGYLEAKAREIAAQEAASATEGGDHA